MMASKLNTNNSTRLWKSACILAIAVSTHISPHLAYSDTTTMKSLKISDAAVFYLELLATRIWLKCADAGDPEDIPKFIARDRLCSEADVKTNAIGWSTICVPARADIAYHSGTAYVRIQLSPGVSGQYMLISMRETVHAGNLGDYRATEVISRGLEETIDRLLVKNPSLQQPFNDGWLSAEGKTFPKLENLFALKVDRAREILDAMRAILSAKVEVELGGESVATLKFFPASDIFKR